MTKTDSPSASTGAPPFAHLRPVAVAVIAGVVTAFVWLAAGGSLPGGRWFAIHVFTLVVLSNAIVAFSYHFARTVLHAPARGGERGRFLLLNVGAVMLLVGLPQHWRVVVGVGATLMIGAVFWLYLDLRRMRKAALAPRFAFVVRAYERASSAFLHGAFLGLLMGIAAVGGAWYGALRLAHLHVNILGWGGLTLLATVVFFGPTLMRARIEDGSEATAARALRHGATGLTVAVFALLLLGFTGAVATGGRIIAAVGLAVYAAAATVICATVVRTARRARPSVHARLITAACIWFPIAAWGDVVAVAGGWWRYLDTVGLILVAGVLLQAIVAALGYFAPMLRGSDPASRTVVRDRLETLGRTRPVALNLGVALIAVTTMIGTSAGTAGAVGIRLGWSLVAATLALTVMLAISSRPAVDVTG